MIGHGINHIEKVLLIAQRLGKLSANIAAYWTTVRLGPMSEMGPIATEMGCPRYVRFSPVSDRRTDIAEFLKRAISGHLGTSFDYIFR